MVNPGRRYSTRPAIDSATNPAGTSGVWAVASVLELHAAIATAAAKPSMGRIAVVPPRGLPPLLPPVRVHAVERRLAAGHPLATADRGFGGLLDLCRHGGFDLRQRRDAPPLLLQILFVQPDRVAPAPVGEQPRGQCLPRLALVVRRMTAHSEGLRHQQRGPLAGPARRRRDRGGGVGIEHVVAVEARAANPVTPG